jgi:hypothetical protein
MADHRYTPTIIETEDGSGDQWHSMGGSCYAASSQRTGTACTEDSMVPEGGNGNA